MSIIKGTDKQREPLAKALEEARHDSGGFEIRQEQFRSTRPGTITLLHLDRTGKVHRIDKITIDGQHQKGEV